MEHIFNGKDITIQYLSESAKFVYSNSVSKIQKLKEEKNIDEFLENNICYHIKKQIME